MKEKKLVGKQFEVRWPDEGAFVDSRVRECVKQEWRK